MTIVVAALCLYLTNTHKDSLCPAKKTWVAHFTTRDPLPAVFLRRGMNAFPQPSCRAVHGRICERPSCAGWSLKALHFQQRPTKLSETRTAHAFSGRLRIAMPMLQLRRVSPILVQKMRSSSAPQDAGRTALADKADSSPRALACGQFPLHDRGEPPGSPHPASSQMAH